MAEVDVPAPGGTFSGATTDRGRTPGGRFAGDGISGVVAQILSDSILWIGPNPPSADQYVLWINTEDARWYGKWNDGDSVQWVDLSLPFGEGLPGPRGQQGIRGLTGPVGQGLPSGGATNEILVKIDGTDYNTTWGVRPEDGLNVLTGTINPTGGVGLDGEHYINTATWTIFGPKAAGVWPSGVSLIGPTGAAGQSVLNGTGVPGGGTGVDGDFYIDTADYDIYGPKTAGAWGSATSLIGPTGATGAGVPIGGAADQLLAKIDATNYNTQWVDAPTSLPAGGATGTVLTKQSATDGDADWAVATGGGGSGGSITFTDRTSLLTNPRFETGDLTGWTTVDAGAAVLAWAASSYDGASMATVGKNGTYILYGVADPFSHYYQDINLVAAGIDGAIGFKATAEGLKDFVDTDVASIEIELLASGGQILAKDTAVYDGTAIGWQNLQCFVWNDDDAVTLRINIKLTRNTGTNNNCAIDNITLATAAAGATVDGVNSVAAARTSLTTTTVVPTTTDTIISWDAAAFQKGGTWFSGGSPTRLTIPPNVSIVEVCAGTIAQAAEGSGTTDFAIRIKKNGTTIVSLIMDNQFWGPPVLTTGAIEVVEGDYFELELWANIAWDLDESNTFLSVAAVGGGGVSLVEMGFKGFRATTAATQAYTSGTLEVNWGTEVFDTEAAFASGRFTVPASLNGYYAVFNTGLVFSTDEDGEILLQRSTDDGATWPDIITQTSMTGAGGAESVGSGPVLLVTGHVYRVAIAMTSSATILDEDRNHFSGQFFAPDATGTVLSGTITTSQNLTDAHFSGNVYQQVDTTSGNITLTIPDTLTKREPCFFENIGTNDLIFAASGTTTINSKAAALTVANRYTGATAMPKGSNVYSLIGDLS